MDSLFLSLYCFCTFSRRYEDVRASYSLGNKLAYALYGKPKELIRRIQNWQPSRRHVWGLVIVVGATGATYFPGGRAVIFEMDTGVRPALRQAGAFGESTGSKNEGSLGESMIFGIR